MKNIAANTRLIEVSAELYRLLAEWVADPDECGCETHCCTGMCLPARSRDALVEAKDFISAVDRSFTEGGDKA